MVSLEHTAKCEPLQVQIAGGPYDLTDRLASRLNPTPCRDVWARNDRGPWARHLANEALVRDNPAVEVDFYGQPVSTACLCK